VSEFGVELRRRRIRRDWSLAELAVRVHYSRGYLSKIENGVLPPNATVARLADAALDAGGSLAALVPAPESGHHELVVPALDGGADPDWSGELLAFGDALAIPLALPSAAARADAEDLRLETHYQEEFERHRRLGQQLAPGLVLRRMAVDFSTLMEVAETSLLPAARLTLLAARYAEFIGWLTQESGRRDLALAWTRRAAAIATRAGGADFAAYTLVREAELAMYERDAATAMELADRALRHPHATDRTRALAAHRQAQVHALRGEHDACLAALGRAEDLLGAAAAEDRRRVPDGPVVGSSTVGNLGGAIAGWCHYDLGRPHRATELLAEALSRTPDTAHRSRALFGARLALAYEASGELEEMQSVTLQAIEDASLARSASAYGELRGLSRALVRRHNVRGLKELRRHLDEHLVRAS
jgi:transcriptional regulator with XRE-family HTH domain